MKEAKRPLLASFRGSRTQEEIGREYGVTQQVWSRWERGDVVPNVVVMKRLERDIGFPMEQIFPDVFNPQKA